MNSESHGVEDRPYKFRHLAELQRHRPRRSTRFHDLRHAAATFLLAQGFTLEDVKNLLGHSSIVLTSNTYGHVLATRRQEVARGMDALLGR